MVRPERSQLAVCRKQQRAENMKTRRSQRAPAATGIELATLARREPACSVCHTVFCRALVQTEGPFAGPAATKQF